MCRTGLLAVLLACVAVGVTEGMTVTAKEAAELPDELKPIMPGGSWFDDTAIKRLRQKHKERKEQGEDDGADEEERFIMSKLKDPEAVALAPLDPQEEEEEVPVAHHHKSQDTREALRSFMRHHTSGGATEEGRAPVTSSTEFMEIYERELQKFFKNFMSVMLQAEIGGVSIENRSEEKKDTESGAPASEFYAVINP